MGSSPAFQLTLPQFLKDIRDVAALVGAPFSESRTQEMLNVFGDSFVESAAIWRITDRPKAQLNYRFYERRFQDCISKAVKAGLIEPGNPMGQLITSWSALHGGELQQSCDFDAEVGLVKAWVSLGGLLPLTDIISTPGVPASIQRHEARFRSLGLQQVRHTCVDFDRQSINFYFHVGEQITEAMAAQYADLAGSEPPSPAIYADMREFLSAKGFALGVTMAYDGGEIERVCFYTLGLSLEKLPNLDDKLLKFFSDVPCHDDEPFNVVGWSFSRAGMYIKVDRSYSGGMIRALRNAGRTFEGNRVL